MNKYLGQISRQMWIAAAVGFVIELIIGLPVLGWGPLRVQYYNAGISNLRPDLQSDYLAMAIQSYARNPNPLLANQRWTELGTDAPTVLGVLQTNPQGYGLKPEDIAGFAAAVKASPAQTGETQAASTPSGGTTTLLIVMCLLTLVVAGLFVYLFLFRNRQPALARAKVSGGGAPVSGGGAVPAPVTYPEGQEQPIAQYLTTYALGNDLYDDSFSIDFCFW